MYADGSLFSYAVAVQDVRGKFASEGNFRIYQGDMTDWTDAFNWIGAQPWSNQRIGSVGCSYLGEQQSVAAQQRHPMHIAAIPQAAGGNLGRVGRHRTFWGSVEGGANAVSINFGWMPTWASIDKGNRQWVDAWDKADASLIAALFAADGVMLGRNGKLFKGPAQVLERMKKVLESAGKGAKATVTTVDLWLDGETAYETGTYTYKFQENGKPAHDEGRYVTIWKRQSDGSWKIASDMGVPKS